MCNLVWRDDQGSSERMTIIGSLVNKSILCEEALAGASIGPRFFFIGRKNGLVRPYAPGIMKLG
jgi:hypothetical protein